MNSRQRRARYRQIKALASQNVRMVMKTGVVHHAQRVTLTQPVDHLASTHLDSNYKCRRPSLWRVKLEWDQVLERIGATMVSGASPLLTRIQTSK